ncbi:MAG TPA: O-antigen ligase family protein [Tepidisphaeraceae bacterium]|jgi:O-antigen ligase|nr:O-antigen ligase family protein [Tepidisphaeraceae bacterium]
MAKTQTQPAEQVEIVYGENLPTWYARLTQGAFYLALALVCARAMMTETLRDPTEISPGFPQVPRGAGAGVAVVLDLLMCLPAVLVLLRRVLDRQYVLRWSISEALLGALAIFAAISTFWSADKWLAGVTAFHFIAMATLVWSAAQLVRSWLRLRWVVAVCFGMLLVHLAQGIQYRFIDYPDNVRYWNGHKAEELARRGWAEGSFEALQLEKKLLSGEMVGFSVSPNTYAAMLVVLTIVSAGAMMQRFKDKDEIGWPIAIAITVPITGVLLFYTQSKTAYATPIIAAIMFGVVGRWSGWMTAHRRQVFWGSVAAVVLVSLAIIGHGLWHHSLVVASLTFRWQYWVGAMHIFTSHPIVGVGWSNFGPYYLSARLPIASEEIKDPHNFVVRVLVELGVIGCALLIGWLLRAAWELTRSVFPPTQAKRAAPANGRTIAILSIGAVALMAIGINILASVDFSMASGSEGGSAFVLLDLLKRVLWFALLMIGFAMVMFQSSQQPQLDERPGPWLLWGILIALAIFLLHNTIDFSIAESGPMFVFALLLGSALGVRTPSVAGKKRNRKAAIGFFAGALALWIFAAVFFVIPIADADSRAQAGDDALRVTNLQSADAFFRSAMAISPLSNSDYAYRAARVSIMSHASDAQTQMLLAKAIAANPMDAGLYMTRAQLELNKPRDQQNRDQLLRDMYHAIALDPNNVEGHLRLAHAYQLKGDAKSAQREIDIAREKNALLDPENPKRLSDAEMSKRVAEAGAN